MVDSLDEIIFFADPFVQADDKFANYAPKTAFLFPGQGAQKVGMAKVRRQPPMFVPPLRWRMVDDGVLWSRLVTLHCGRPAIALIWDLQEACEQSATAKELFDKASDILGYDLLKVCTEGILLYL